MVFWLALIGIIRWLWAVFFLGTNMSRRRNQKTTPFQLPHPLLQSRFQLPKLRGTSRPHHLAWGITGLPCLRTREVSQLTLTFPSWTGTTNIWWLRKPSPSPHADPTLPCHVVCNLNDQLQLSKSFRIVLLSHHKVGRCSTDLCLLMLFVFVLIGLLLLMLLWCTMSSPRSFISREWWISFEQSLLLPLFCCFYCAILR